MLFTQNIFKAFFTLLITGITLSAFSQTEVILNTPDAGNKTYVASDYINLKPGYTYSANSNNSLHAYIDETVLGTTNYGNLFSDNDILNRSLNTSLPVGSISGSHDVTPTGGATYNIPIQIAPGTNGIVPNLAVVYNSQASNGILGMGWNLAGLSAITRVPKTIYHNGTVGAVQLTTDDNFALDGNRLIVVGENGTNIIYGTEAESFSRITSYGVSGNGTTWFKVETKDGKTYEYGNSSDSRFVQENGNTVIYWLLNKVYDSYGNYIEFKYRDFGREFHIAEIKYTGNSTTGMQPYNSVKFFYKDRNDKNTSYIAGSSVNNNLLLDKIKVLAEGQLMKSYEFEYGQNLSSYLKEVKEIASDGSQLNSTVFQYGAAGDSIKITPGPLNSFYTELCPGDYNGDGLTDLLVVKYNLVYGPSYGPYGAWHDKLKHYQSWKMYHSNGTQLNPVSQSNNIFDNVQYSETSPSLWGGSIMPFGMSSSDFNGDGNDDFIFTSEKTDTSGGNGGTLNRVKICLTNSTGDNFASTQEFVSDQYNRKAYNNYLFIGDFDGDGATDFMTILSNGTTCKAFMYFPRIGTQKFEITGINVQSITQFSKVSVIDFDGDGKQELMVVNNSNTTIYSFNKTSGEVSANVVYSGNYPTTGDKIYFGDFNGDGLTDILTSDNYWSIGYSDGKHYNEVPIDCSIPLDNDYGYVKTGDYNGDGKTDVLYFSPTGSILDIYYSKGNDQLTYPQDQFTYSHNTYTPSVNSFISEDFNGDGKVDEIAYNTTNTIPVDFIYFNKDGQDNLLKRVSNGFNNITEFNYTTLAKGTNYVKGSTANYPLNDFQKPLYVVTSVKTPNGIGGNSTTSFSYQKAIVHKQGKGFLGFTKVIATDTTQKRTIEREFEFNNTYYIPLLKYQRTYLTTNNSIIEITQNTNSITPLSNNRFFAHVDQTITTNNITWFANTSSSLYDNYGNVTQVNNTQTAVNMGTAQTTVTTNQYGQYGAWVPSKIISTTSTTTREVTNPPSAYTRTANYTYYNNGGLKTEVSDPSTAKSVTTAYTYDGYGNPTQVTTSAAGVQSKTNKMWYDSKYRFVIKTSNPLNQYEERTYDAKWGKPLTVKGIDGLTTAYIYDCFGRLIKSIAPNSVETNSSLVWDIQAGGASTPTTVNNAVFYSLTTQQGSPDTKTWFDILGRERKTETQGFNQAIYTVKAYDNKGNIKTQTAPFFVGETPVITTNSYDDYNRLISVQNDTGTVIYSYYKSGSLFCNKVTNPAGQISYKMTDASGKVAKVQDDVELLEYSYFSSGNVKNIKVHGQQVASMQYDIYGNQTLLDEKNAGTTHYNYNALGELVSQTDANNNKDSICYDILGRVTKKIGPDGITSYLYVTSGNGINQIKKITGPNGITHEYIYDAYSRVTQETETIDAQTFTTQYGYDNFGNNTYVIYPSGFRINKNYDSKGYFTSTTNAQNQAIFTANTSNALGQLTNYALGNGITTIKTIDKYGMPKRLKAGNVQDLILKFNAQTGNLTSRKDAIKNLQESFIYDKVNRLTNVQSASSPLVINYSTNGNISNKSDVGDYTYDVNKINAVASVANTNKAIGPLQQNITYTPFQKTATVSEGNNVLTYTYGPDQQRKKSILMSQGNTIKTTYYLPNYEKIIIGSNTYEVHYIGGGDGLCAMYVKTNGVGAMYYVYLDQLGSLLTITNAQGAVVAEQSFDAWGRKRNPNNWTYNNIPSNNFSWLQRGYTGHEQLDSFALINMNGRMYDPILARMLSPDNFTQDPDNSQNFNRYSYCVNNPLKYTDPDGEWFLLDDLVAALIGGVVNWAFNGCQFNAKGLGYFGAGAAAGDLALYGPVGWAAGGAIIGSSNAALGGAKGWDVVEGGLVGTVSGLVGGAVGSWAAKGLGGILINGFNVTSPIVKGAIGGTIGGAGGGYAGGFTAGLITTGDISEANKAGIKGLTTGFAIGGITGSIGGYAAAKQHGINPWTGRPNRSITIGEGMDSRVSPMAKELSSETLPSENMPEAYFGKEINSRYTTSGAMKSNAEWIDTKMQNDYYIYDIGPTGSAITSPYYNMEVGRTMAYPNVYNVYQIQRIPSILFIYK